MRFIAVVVLFLFSTKCVLAQNAATPEDINFQTNQTFIVSLSRVLMQDYAQQDVQRVVAQYNREPTGFRAKSYRNLVEKLPLAADDLLKSANQLGLLYDPPALVKLQNAVYQSAIGSMSVRTLQNRSASVGGGAIAAPLALLGGLAAAGGGGGGGGGGDGNTSAATLVDPQLSLSIDTTTFVENGGITQATLTLNRALTSDLQVNLAYSSGAIRGTDFAANQTVNIPAGQTQATFDITAIDDGVYEGHETAQITIASVDQRNVSISSSRTASIVIMEDEIVPTVSLAASSTSVSEESGSGITFTASLDQIAAEDLVVTLSITVNSRARSYTANVPASLDITIPAGSFSGSTVYQPTNNTSYDGTSSVSFAVTSVGGNNTISDNVVISTSDAVQTIEVTETEAAPTVSLSSTSTTMAEDGVPVVVTATLSNAAYEAVIVPLITSGTATEGSDYQVIGDIVIPAGSTTGTADIIPINDQSKEDTETISIALGTISGADATASSAANLNVTLGDDDSVVVQLTAGYSNIAEDSDETITLTALVSNLAEDDVIVALDIGGTATRGVDYVELPTFITIPAGQWSGSTTFTPIDDDVSDAAGTETVIISIGSITVADTIDQNARAVTLNILDDEASPTVSLSVSGASSATLSEGGSANITATLSVPTTVAVTVPLAVTGSVSDHDYVALSDITIDAGATTGSVIFRPVDDATFEGGETATIKIGEISGGSATIGDNDTVVLSIADAQSAPVITLTASANTTSERSNQPVFISVSSDVAASQDMIISFAVTGTGITNSDYTISTVTLDAQTQGGSASFNAIDDEVYEGGAEVAIISVGSVSGVSGVTGAGTVSITINEHHLDAGTTATFDANAAEAERVSEEFMEMNYDGNSENPLEVINAHKAHGYGLTGAGQVVAVMDSGFDLRHDDLSATTITQSGSITLGTGYSIGDDHGAIVTGVIAGNNDGAGIVGVAPSADLHLTDYTVWDPSSWATLMDSATEANAVAQNNSWGFDQQYGAAGAGDFVQYMNDNNLTGAETLVAFQTIDTDGDGYFDVGVDSTPVSWTENDWNAYVTSLNNFQDNGGAIVFALSNDATKTDADISAALPELFPSLAEAWITVGNVDKPDGSSDYLLHSAPCGSTAEYCLVADGYDIVGIAYDPVDTDWYWGDIIGTSFAAPQVSGAVAILTEAFPNHTIEQITDRLLASANNDLGFSYVGSTTFGNGVVHDYSAEAGHGMLDIYAALQPITSSSYIARLYAGNAGEGVGTYSAADTAIRASRSFGDAIASALEGEHTYVYDALDGGFSVTMDHLIKPALVIAKPSMRLKTEISRTISSADLRLSMLPQQPPSNTPLGYFEAGVQQSNKTLRAYVSNGAWTGFNDVQYMFPFLSDIQSGDGISFGDEVGTDYVSFTWNKQHASVLGGAQKEAITVSYDAAFGEDTRLNLIAGIADENEDFLGTTGSGAFDFTGAHNITSFLGLKSTSQLRNDVILSAGFALSHTAVNKPASGIITAISGVTASAFEIGVTKFDLLGDDAVSLSLGQPHRVETGSAHLKFAGLAGQGGRVPFTTKTAKLAPTGRQIDLAMAYNFDLDEHSAVRMKMIETFEKGHVRGATPETSVYLGYSTSEVIGNDILSIGAAMIDDRVPSFDLSYTVRW